MLEIVLYKPFGRKDSIVLDGKFSKESLIKTFEGSRLRPRTCELLADLVQREVSKEIRVKEYVRRSKMGAVFAYMPSN